MSLGEELVDRCDEIVQVWYDRWRQAHQPGSNVSEAALKHRLPVQLRLIGNQLRDLSTAEDPRSMWTVTSRLDPEKRVAQEFSVAEVVQEYQLAVDIVRDWIAERRNTLDAVRVAREDRPHSGRRFPREGESRRDPPPDARGWHPAGRAVQYTRAAGAPPEARRRDSGSGDHAGSRASGERVLFRVRDSGTGVAPEQQDTLFKDVQPGGGIGTGLGLRIANHAVLSMGGTMGVESEPGKGSAFWFEIPIAVSARS